MEGQSSQHEDPHEATFASLKTALLHLIGEFARLTETYLDLISKHTSDAAAQAILTQLVDVDRRITTKLGACKGVPRTTPLAPDL